MYIYISIYTYIHCNHDLQIYLALRVKLPRVSCMSALVSYIHIHVQIHIYIYIHTHIYIHCSRMKLPRVSCMSALVSYIHTCINTYIYIYIRTHVYIHCNHQRHIYLALRVKLPRVSCISGLVSLRSPFRSLNDWLRSCSPQEKKKIGGREKEGRQAGRK